MSIRPAAAPMDNKPAQLVAKPRLEHVVGLVCVVALAAIIAFAVTSFRGGFNDYAPLTVVSPRAGLVMDPDAKVKLLGVQIGRVESIESRQDGQAVLHLSIESAKMSAIPENIRVDIASTTVFGAKFVELVLPDDPSLKPIRAGQVLQSDHVTVEINTVFQQLTSVLGQIEPAKLNETLGAISRAISGRGKKIGQSMRDLDSFLATVDPALPAMSHDLSQAPQVVSTYADTAADLLKTATNATTLSITFVEEQKNLDAFLVSVIGLGTVGNQFLTTNGRPLTDVMRLLVPTTSLLDEYSPGLNCGMMGMLDLANVAEANPTTASGIQVSVNFVWGHERYRYPADLPKVAASGGPQCGVLPVKYQTHPPYVVTDTGTNPFKRGNQGWVLNADGLKQFLFGPLDGPPRNSAQVGQPG
jgi:phospholipid/cholesterol/gamma-HCH transport system substrate-binding protein